MFPLGYAAALLKRKEGWNTARTENLATSQNPSNFKYKVSLVGKITKDPKEIKQAFMDFGKKLHASFSPYNP